MNIINKYICCCIPNNDKIVANMIDDDNNIDINKQNRNRILAEMNEEIQEHLSLDETRNKSKNRNKDEKSIKSGSGSGIGSGSGSYDDKELKKNNKKNNSNDNSKNSSNSNVQSNISNLSNASAYTGNLSNTATIQSNTSTFRALEPEIIDKIKRTHFKINNDEKFEDIYQKNSHSPDEPEFLKKSCSSDALDILGDVTNQNSYINFDSVINNNFADYSNSYASTKINLFEYDKDKDKK